MNRVTTPQNENVRDQSITHLTGLCSTTPWTQNVQSHFASGNRKTCVDRTSRISAKFILHSLHIFLFWMRALTQNMETDKPHGSGLSERRFGIILLLFKIAGIPLNTHSVSILQSLYNITTAACHYVTCASCFMDLYVNINNLEELVKSIRLCLSMTFITVIDIFFRYLKRTLTHLNNIRINFKNSVLNLRFLQRL
jgi:hypothetical protein